MNTSHQEVMEFVANVVRFHPSLDAAIRKRSKSLLRQAFFLLPAKVRDRFLGGIPPLSILVLPDEALPVGMTTGVEVLQSTRTYLITMHSEHLDWPDKDFIGAFLRELGHVEGRRPPEDEWPIPRAERSKFREILECRADAMVWRWGLKEYSLAHLNRTYPAHWMERIVADIEAMLAEPLGHV
jgi:hypothetical protein